MKNKRLKQTLLFIILMIFPLYQEVVMTFVWNPILKLLGA